MATMRRVNDRRRALGALAMAAALTACGSGAAPTPATASSAPEPVSATATAPPAAEVDPGAVEAAVSRVSGCTVDERYGRDLDGVRFLLVGVGRSGVPIPHQPQDGSFICNLAPAGTQSFGAVRLGDPTRAAATADWFRGGDPCRPVGTVGSWMLFAARPADQPQDSRELEDAVAELGGQMDQTCRRG